MTIPRPPIQLWHDRDKRRALLLSLFIHLVALLLFAWLLVVPTPPPPETFLVIDLGTPAPADTVETASAAAEPAPPSPTPQVADPATGEPQARSAPQEQPAAPEPEPQTALPPPPPQAAPATVPPPAAARPAEAPLAPAPRLAIPSQAVTPNLPVAQSATSVLPEIDEVRLEPRPLAAAIQIPMPTPVTEVPPARTITPSPTVQVASPQTVPQPQVRAAVAAPQAVPQPQASAVVAAPQVVPQPQVSAAVAEAQSVPTPQVQASVAPAREVPVPQAEASVPTPQAVPEPQVSATVADAQAVPQPQVQAQVTPARPLAVSPQVQVATPLPVPSPQVSATLREPDLQIGAAPPATPAPVGNSATASNRLDRIVEGGNADRGGQPDTLPAAAAGNVGAAAAPDGSADPSGAPLALPQAPYSERRERPLAVLIDNVNGYPQAGLVEASQIVEMPVEGGLSRLMTVYDRIDPVQVGPVRSARDYFHELVLSFDGILVHDGGSPAALAAIGRSDLPTLNAFERGDLFSRRSGRSAPYNLYSGGNALRDAVNRLSLANSRLVRGVIFRPPVDAPVAETVEVAYSGEYRTGFAYQSELDLYRWVRNGDRASDASGEAVFVDAVLVASIAARRIPGDEAGRLYISLVGGEATLYLHGRAIEGRWLKEGGVSFVTDAGEAVDLTPFKTWVVFAP